MAAKRAESASVLKWHPSLKKTFKDCERWWRVGMLERDDLTERLEELRGQLGQSGILRIGATTLGSIGQIYTVGSCVLAEAGNTADFATSFCWGIEFRALDFRSLAGRSLPHEHQPLLPFGESMKSAGPAVLSQWELASTCARILIDVAVKDRRVTPPQWHRDSWGRGTNDAFLIFLFSQAFGIETNYAPAKPLVPEYQSLLDVWRTEDAGAFQTAMQAASEFHISRSRSSTNKMTYEFERNFDTIFPAELLAVQALRRRFELPEFKAEHLLVDTPWSLIRDLPAVEPHPLYLEAEARFRLDFSSFR